MKADMIVQQTANFRDFQKLARSMQSIEQAGQRPDRPHKLTPLWRPTMNKFALTLAAVFATASALLPAYAHAAEDTRIEKTAFVNIADLDLATSKGQSKLNARISAAARKVCTLSGTPANSDFDRCVVIAKANAKASSVQKIADAMAKRAQIAAR